MFLVGKEANKPGTAQVGAQLKVKKTKFLKYSKDNYFKKSFFLIRNSFFEETRFISLSIKQYHTLAFLFETAQAQL